MSKATKETTERLSRQEAFRQPLKIIFPKNWIVFFALIVLVSLLVLWAFMGRIPTEVTGKAVSLSPGGTFQIESGTDGKVSALFVVEGDRVEKNAPLGEIYNPELHSVLVQIEATEYKIGRLITERTLLEEALEINQQLLREGLIAKLVVDDSKAKLYDKQIAIEEARSELGALFSRLEGNSAAPKEVVEAIKEQLLDQKLTLEFTEIEKVLSTIRSPESGTILEVLVSKGDRVERKDSIIWAEHPIEQQKHEVFYSTLNANVIGRVEKGMRVLVEPLIVNPQEYGAIIGSVSAVNRYPVSQEELTDTIGNPQIVKFLIGNASVVTLVVVEPKSNPNTVSGFEWPSNEGPPFTIPTGSVANVKIVIDEQPPISYLIPLWKIKEPLPLKNKKQSRQMGKTAYWWAPSQVETASPERYPLTTLQFFQKHLSRSVEICKKIAKENQK